MEKNRKPIIITDPQSRIARIIIQAAENRKIINDALMSGKAHELKGKGFRFFRLDI